MLDFVLSVGVMLPIMYGLGEFDEVSSVPDQPFTFALTLTDVASSFALFVVMNGYFLVKNGQTIGKRLIGIRVVNVSDGAQTAFWKLAVVRELPQLLLCLIPFVGIWLSMLEPLFIARADLRTGHDLWSGTRVVKVMRSGSHGPRQTLEEAKRAVEVLANQLRGASPESGALVVEPTSIRRFETAWFMCVQTERFLETRDRSYAVIGTPCFVVEDSGRIVRHPQNQLTAEFLAPYGREVGVNETSRGPAT